MIKKIVLYLFVVIICAMGVVKIEQGVQEKDEANNGPKSLENNIFNKDKDKLKGHFNKQILNDENWKSINDYSIPPANLVTSEKSEKLFKLAIENIETLSVCLMKDYCGMEKKSDQDAYFDDAKTPGHILLGRNLEIISEALKINGKWKDEVDWDLIRELSNNKNEKIQKLAFYLLFNYGEKTDLKNEAMSLMRSYKGQARALALLDLSAGRDTKSHRQLVHLISQTFLLNDPNTVISVLEKMGRMKLSVLELKELSKSICHFQDDELGGHNWKMMNFLLKKQMIDLQGICF
jgi:hypothetical protein